MVKTPIYSDSGWIQLSIRIMYRIKNQVLYVHFKYPTINLDAVNNWKVIGRIPITLPFAYDFKIGNNEYYSAVVDCRIDVNGYVAVGSADKTSVILTGLVSLPL